MERKERPVDDDPTTTICENCAEECEIVETGSCHKCGMEGLCSSCQAPDEHGCECNDDED